MSPYALSDQGNAHARLMIEMREEVCVEETRLSVTGCWEEGLLVPISALMDVDRHFVGILCHWRLAKADAQSSDRRAARNLTHEPYTVWSCCRLFDSFPFQICVCQQGGWHGAIVTQALTAWSLPECVCAGFSPPTLPQSKHMHTLANWQA